MTDRINSRLARCGTAILTAIASLCAASAAHAAGKTPPTYSEEQLQPVLGGFRIGFTAAWLDRAQSADSFNAYGLLGEMRVGAQLSPSYATGVGARGGWSLPTDFNLDSSFDPAFSGRRAKGNQLLNGTLYWFHQFGAPDSFSVRLSAGPHVSELRSDEALVNEDPLWGAEVGVELRPWLSSPINADWSSNMWFSAFVAHSLGHDVDADSTDDRETAVAFAVSFDLETLPRVNKVSRP